ncbi:MAG: DEAD/DEAH box helicase family protein, partial [Myxococcota bacterium]|nr:DEAD/DEAH box helicase family protein [Myxococcota bacterium]
MFKLRPYQEEAIDEVSAARERGVKRMLISLPTGAGKTVIFSRLAAQAERQVLILAHREELLTQAKDKLERTLESMG